MGSNTPNTALKIVTASEADIPALNDLIHCCYRGEESFKGWTSEAHLLGGIRATPELLAGEMSDPTFTYLKGINESGEIIACCRGQKQGNATMFAGMLCVRPELQGAGLGKKMMAAIADVAREANCSRLRIRVIEQRKELVEWYVRQGFKPNGHTESFEAGAGVGIPKTNLSFIDLDKLLQ